MTQPVRTETVSRCAICKAQASCIFGDLTPEQFQRFAAIACLMVRKKDEVLFHEGETAQGIYIIRSGQVRLLTTTATGKLVPVGVAEPGDILEVKEALAGGEFAVTAKASEPCELEYVVKDRFLRFLKESPDVQLELLQKLSVESLKLTRRFAQTQAESAMERFKHVLLDLCETCGEPAGEGPAVRLKLEMTGQELADLVGVSREWVSKLLGQLKQKGVIKLADRRILMINKVALGRDLECKSGGLR